MEPLWETAQVDESGENAINKMLAEAQAMSDALRSAYRPMPQVVEVSDRANALTVTLEDHGARVTRVILAADWKDKIASGNLGVTVMEAIHSVRLENIKEFFDEATTTLRAPSHSPSPPDPQPSAPPPVDMARLMRNLSWDDLGRMLETVHKALDAMSAGIVPAMANDTVSGRSDNRRVEVTLVAGQPSSVVLDEEWARKMGRQQVSDSIRQAFESAYAEAAARTEGRSRDAGVVGELQSVIGKFGISFPPPVR